MPRERGPRLAKIALRNLFNLSSGSRQGSRFFLRHPVCRIDVTAQQTPFLWYCSALATAEKPHSTHAQCSRYIGSDRARGWSAYLHSLCGKSETRVHVAHPRNSSPRRIIATKSSVVLAGRRITSDIPRARLQKRDILSLAPLHGEFPRGSIGSR